MRAWATLLACVVLGLSTSVTEGGDFVVSDDQTLRLVVSHPDWNYVRNYVDGYQEKVFVFDAEDGNTVTFRVEPVGDYTADDFEWIYLYFGDGTGQFVELGQTVQHVYADKSRYNPTVIAKLRQNQSQLAKGSWAPPIHPLLGFYLMDGWTEPPSEWPRPSYTPPTTGNEELDNILKDLAIDNSSYTEKLSGCANNAEGDCLESTDGNSTCRRYCLY